MLVDVYNSVISHACVPSFLYVSVMVWCHETHGSASVEFVLTTLIFAVERE